MNKNTFKIAKRKVGLNYDPLIIAEIGINHGGNIKTALKMAKLAIDSGVDVIKHQTHIVDDEMSQQAKKTKIDYIGKSIYELMDNCALNEKDELTLKNFVEEHNCIFLSTPFSRKAADRLYKFGVPAFKIGSGECNNFPLLEHICKFKKPIILSTGMNNLEDIHQSVEILRSYKIPYALLHTTNIYPTPHELVRLNAMTELEENFPDAVIGLSDHTVDNYACFGALAMGASIIERHFTDSLKRKGPDILNSMDPKQTSELVRASKIYKLLRGGIKKRIKEENTVKQFAFSSVVSIKEIRKGEKFSYDNIWVKRPGSGPFFAKDFHKIIGKTANKDIKRDFHIKKIDIKEKI